MEPETIRRYRDEASENLLRWAEAGPLSPARQHLKALLDEREGRIVALADALLEVVDGLAACHAAFGHMEVAYRREYAERQRLGQMVAAEGARRAAL